MPNASVVTAQEAADKLFARLDRNKDGVLDGPEWDEVGRMLERDRYHMERMPPGPAKDRALSTLAMQEAFLHHATVPRHQAPAASPPMASNKGASRSTGQGDAVAATPSSRL